MTNDQQSGKKIVNFLQAEFDRRRATQAEYSLRAFAFDLGTEAATLSQLLKQKRRMTFETARDLLSRIELPLHVRNSLLLSLDDPEQHSEPAEPTRVLNEDELERLADWESYAVLSALDLKNSKPTAVGIAAAIGADVKKVEALLNIFLSLGMIREDRGEYSQTGVMLTTSNNIPSAALCRAHREWMEKAIEALGARRADCDFSGITVAAPTSKLEEAQRRIREFRRSLAAWLAEGEEDAVVRLNIQLFPVRPAPIRMPE